MDKAINAFWRGNTLRIVQRNANDVVVREVPAEHCFFLREEDTRSKPDVLRQCRDSRQCIGILMGDEWVKVRWRYDRPNPQEPANHVKIAKFIEATHRVPTYEADISPVRRWMVDHDIEVDRPRRCYLDIETDSRVPFSQKTKARILAWVIVGEGDGSDVTAGVLDADNDCDEHNLLVAMWKALAKYDQVLSWNGDRFDFPMVIARSEKLGLKVEPRRWLWLDHLVLFRRLNVASESGDEKQSMSLDSVSKAILGTGKLEGVDGSQSWSLWESNRGKLLDYCAVDTQLMRRIEAETGYAELLQTLCEATHTFPDTFGAQPMGQVETFLMRLGKTRNLHTRSRFGMDEIQQFDGAFVMPPTSKGIVRNAHVADFARLYPSIILSWNISPETYRPDVVLKESTFSRPAYLSHLPPAEYPLPDGHCAAAIVDRAFANEPRGILSVALDEMLRLRSQWNKKKAALPPGTHEWKEADRRSSAYKIAANSFYGVVGSPFSRFYVREVAESVSQCGVWLIKETIKEAQAKGIEVFYGDTDSLFATGCTREQFADFVRDCNATLYPRLLASKGCVRNEIELAYEKGFERIVMVTAKRYAGRYSHYKGTDATADSKPEVKGLEWKRGDVSRMTRTMQGEAIELIMAGDDPPEPDAFYPLLDRWCQHVLEGQLELADVLLSKRISKPLSEYQRRVNKDGSFAKEPPHVRVARLLKERGEDMGEGSKVAYFVADGEEMTVVPASDWAGNVDRHYVWESMVYSPTMRLLAAAYPAADWKKWERTRPAKVRATKSPAVKPVRLRRSTIRLGRTV